MIAAWYQRTQRTPVERKFGLPNITSVVSPVHTIVKSGQKQTNKHTSGTSH